MLECPAKKLTGFDCPGCGLQRSFWALVEGNIGESIALYPPLIPFLITLLMLCVYLKFRKKAFLNILLFFYILSAALVVINYIYKLSQIS